jgi:hypothetical protein
MFRALTIKALKDRFSQQLIRIERETRASELVKINLKELLKINRLEDYLEVPMNHLSMLDQ